MLKLLTGATGLLGRYLMRDLMLLGHPLVVLVRAGKRASAAQRIEQIIVQWEEQAGRAFPRPLVIEGDITEKMAGLDNSDIRWLGQNCEQIVHSAARLTFYEKDGEPWKSNVQGTQHLLDVCQASGIDTMHHISSAYVAGNRTGVVLEDELDVGQAFGNDYERSKVGSEKLVRGAKQLKRFTIYRPSIIMGDSRTGFSSTFHGFYTPLRLAAAMSAVAGVDRFFAADHMQQMGLQGDEGKNFVPVDWVSEIITTLIDQQPCEGETYAVVSDDPVPVQRLYRVYKDSLSAESGTPSSTVIGGTQRNSTDFGPTAVINSYNEQMAVYRSYLRDDPSFDATHTKKRLPYMRCPELTDSVLLRLCEYALQHRFAWRPEPVTDNNECTAQSFTASMNASAVELPENTTENFVLTVTGAGGGCWSWGNETESSDGILKTQWRVGNSSMASAEVRMNSQTFETIISDPMALHRCANDGRILIVGNESESLQWLGRSMAMLR
ncbi:SDR family oxidoreductase [bacterium]|nr:SDR family oxidoreductase [bacterium]